MKVAIMELRLYAPWVHSLKEKRMAVKSLLGKIRSRYVVSAAETDEQEDDILAFVESSTEAEIVSVEREIR